MAGLTHIKKRLQKEIAPRVQHFKGQSPKTTEQIKPGAFSSWFEVKKLKGGWFKCPHFIIAQEDLKSPAFRILVTLISHARTKDLCLVKQEKLQKEAGLDRRALKKGSDWLRDNHWIAWKRTGRSNVYVLLFKNENPKKRLKEFKAAPNWLLIRKAINRKDLRSYS